MIKKMDKKLNKALNVFNSALLQLNGINEEIYGFIRSKDEEIAEAGRQNEEARKQLKKVDYMIGNLEKLLNPDKGDE